MRVIKHFDTAVLAALPQKIIPGQALMLHNWLALEILSLTGLMILGEKLRSLTKTDLRQIRKI